MTAIGYIEACAAPLDRARRTTFRWAAAVPTLRAILYRRDRRIAVQASIGVVVAFALVVAAPLAVMAVAPIVFGVPHVASDIRYLVLRQPLPRWWRRAALAGCAALFALSLAGAVAGLGSARLEMIVAAAWIAGAAVAGAAVSGTWQRLHVAGPVVAGAAVFAIANPVTTQLVFAHLHNIIALGLWAVLFRRRRAIAAAPLALVAVGATLLVLGATTGATARLGGNAALGIDLVGTARWLAPGLAPQLAIGVTLAFIYLQSVHYAVWLGWIPQEHLPGESTMSFKSSLRSAVRDLGRGGFYVVVGAMVAVLAASLVSLHGTRNAYLSLAVFHGYLELAMACYFLMARPAARAR